MRSRSFKDIIVQSDPSEDYFIPLYLKRKLVKHGNTAFPYLIVTFHLLGPQRRMKRIFNEKLNLIFKYPFDVFWQMFKILFKGFGSGYLHSYSSFKKSSTDEKLLTLPCLISSSASSSAFVQSKSLKYFGRDRACSRSSFMADELSGRFVFFQGVHPEGLLLENVFCP